MVARRGARAEIAALPHAPLGVRREWKVRLSLAGVQPKLGLARGADGPLGLPLNGHPTTHILKPPATARDHQGQLLFPELAENEALCLRLAAHAGLSSAPSRSSVRAPMNPAYSSSGMTGMPTPEPWSFGRTRRTPVRLSASDARGKNVSFLYRDGAVGLAPFYDVVSTAVYPQHPRDLAMRIGGEFFLEDVPVARFEQAYEDCGLRAALARRRLPETIDGLVAAADAALADAERERWRTAIVDQVRDRVRTVGAHAGRLTR